MKKGKENVRYERRSTVRGGRDLHFVRIYCPRQKGMRKEKGKWKHMDDSFFTAVWNMEFRGFQQC
jgi:hypothetical protein